MDGAGARVSLARAEAGHSSFRQTAFRHPRRLMLKGTNLPFDLGCTGQLPTAAAIANSGRHTLPHASPHCCITQYTVPATWLGNRRRVPREGWSRLSPGRRTGPKPLSGRLPVSSQRYRSNMITTRSVPRTSTYPSGSATAAPPGPLSSAITSLANGQLQWKAGGGGGRAATSEADALCVPSSDVIQ